MQNADIVKLVLSCFYRNVEKYRYKSLPSIIFQSESNIKSADCVRIPSFYMKTTALFYRKTRALAQLNAWCMYQLQEWPDRDLYITQKANIV